MLEAGYIPELVVVNIPRTGELVWYPSLAELATINEIPVIRANIVAGKQDILEKIKYFNPDLFVVSSFRNILDSHLLDIPKKGSINLHMAPLPKYRGAHPENWAIINGERWMGYTVHYLDEDVDTGDIIAKDHVPILPEDDVMSLTYKLAETGPKLLVRVLKALENGTAERTPQDENESSYYPPRKPIDGLVDWSKPALEIHNLVRALVRPYPGAFSYLRGQKFRIWRTRLIGTQGKGEPGEIIQISSDGIMVLTGDDAILILEWSWEVENQYENLLREKFGYGNADPQNNTS